MPFKVSWDNKKSFLSRIVAQELFHHSQPFGVVERSPAMCRAMNNLELNRGVHLFQYRGLLPIDSIHRLRWKRKTTTGQRAMNEMFGA
jgi:hypothetical protein